jgi:hypothetical protein
MSSEQAGLSADSFVPLTPSSRKTFPDFHAVRRGVLVDGFQLAGEAVAFHLPFSADSQIRMSLGHGSIMPPRR